MKFKEYSCIRKLPLFKIYALFPRRILDYITGFVIDHWLTSSTFSGACLLNAINAFTKKTFILNLAWADTNFIRALRDCQAFGVEIVYLSLEWWLLSYQCHAIVLCLSEQNPFRKKKGKKKKKQKKQSC